MKIKKNDLILVLVILCVAGACLFMYTKFGQKNAGKVVVKIDGEEKGTYSLSKNTEVSINNTNVFVIEDGEVKMIRANCPDQICVKHKAISKNKESIICLPNKVVVEIVSDEQADLDTIAN